MSVNNIVIVDVSTIIAPSPSKLQKTGAFISQGGTDTTPGTMTILTRYTDLATVLTEAKTISGLAWSGGVVTVTTASPHGFPSGDEMLINIAGTTPAGYSGTFLATITGASTFTYPLASDPGADTVAGVYTPQSAIELTAMARTFFTQGNQQAVYVLELGPGSVDTGVEFLTEWIDTNPETIYSYLTPRAWDGVDSFLDMLALYEGTTAKTYFFVTTTLQNYGLYEDTLKDAFLLIESPKTGKWPRNELTAIASDGDGLVTASTTTAHGVAVNDYFTISGVTPAAYNGTFLALPGTSGSTLFYQLREDPSTDPVFASGSFAGGTGNITIVTEDAHGLGPGDVITVSDATGTGSYAEADGVHTLISGTTGSSLVYSIAVAAPVFSAGSYNTGDGEVELTTVAPHGFVEGDPIIITGASGTGSFASVNGSWTCIAGTTGSTIKFLIADSLTITLSGATINRIALTLTDAQIAVGADVLGALQASLYSNAGVPATEFTAAAPFWVTLNYNPAPTNKVTPTAFTYMYGVTAFPLRGNLAWFTRLEAAAINIIGTGAEGGISNDILDWGTTKDGRDFTYWYSVDWVQINAARNVANAVINGSNNSVNPLYYNQQGIDRLQQVVISTMASGISNGLVLGQIVATELNGADFDEQLDSGALAGQTVINAVPFVDYARANPNDYPDGIYNGLSIVYTPNRGFRHIRIQVVVTDFVAA